MDKLIFFTVFTLWKIYFTWKIHSLEFNCAERNSEISTNSINSHIFNFYQRISLHDQKNSKRIRIQCNSEQILSLTCSSYPSTDRKNVISVFLPQIVATVLMSIEFAVCASSTYHIFTATRCKNTNGMQHKLFCSESVVESTFLDSLCKTVVQKLLVFGKFLGKVCKLELRHYYASVTFSSSKLFLELLYFSTILNFTCSW